MTNRNVYNISTTFDIPMEGVVTIAAENEDQAKKIMLEMFKARKNVEVVDIYDIKDAPGIEEIMEVDDSGKPVTLN